MGEAPRRRGRRGTRGCSRRVRQPWRALSGIRFAEAQFELSNQAQTVTFPDGTVHRFPPSRDRVRMLLATTSAGWQVKALEPLQ